MVLPFSYPFSSQFPWCRAPRIKWEETPAVSKTATPRADRTMPCLTPPRTAETVRTPRVKQHVPGMFAPLEPFSSEFWKVGFCESHIKGSKRIKKVKSKKNNQDTSSSRILFVILDSSIGYCTLSPALGDLSSKIGP